MFNKIYDQEYLKSIYDEQNTEIGKIKTAAQKDFRKKVQEITGSDEKFVEVCAMPSLYDSNKITYYIKRS